MLERVSLCEEERLIFRSKAYDRYRAASRELHQRKERIKVLFAYFFFQEKVGVMYHSGPPLSRL